MLASLIRGYTLVDDNEDSVLHIGGIFPIGGKGGWQGGQVMKYGGFPPQACEPAASLALEDVNNRKDLLPGFTLKLHWNDSECEPGLGASVMYNLLYNKPQKLMLLAGCSTVCTTVAEAAKMWNLVVLCYGASSPALSDRNRFPTLFRTHPSATVHNPTRIKLMEKFGWSRVAILQQAEEVFISVIEDLEARCKESGIEIVTRQSFLSDPTDAVRNLRRQDARIIVGLFYVVAARRVLCEMYKQNIHGKSYVWFFIANMLSLYPLHSTSMWDICLSGWYEDNWFEVNLKKEDINCTKEQMKVAAEGHLTTEALMWNQGNQRTISGKVRKPVYHLRQGVGTSVPSQARCRNQCTISGKNCVGLFQTSEDFRVRLNEMLQKSGYEIDHNRFPEGYQEAPLAYDAVWAVALGKACVCVCSYVLRRLSDTDGGARLSDTDGGARLSDTDGGARLSDTDGGARLSDTDGGATLSDTDGGARLSDTDGGARLSDTDGGARLSDTDGGATLSDTDGGARLSDTDAFNKTMERLHRHGKSLKNFTYTDKETADGIYSAINSTQFLGVSGHVAFSSQGDRIALTQIEQMIDGKYVKLGYYDTQADNLTWMNEERWIGGKVPQDRTIVRRELRTVSLPLFICMWTVSCLGILCAIGLIVFNILYRHRRVIQSSHPVCNTIMLLGVCTCLWSVFLLGLDGQFVGPAMYPMVCQARAWMLTTGFTLAYGAMFSKVWRVHRLTTKAKIETTVMGSGVTIMLLELKVPAGYIASSLSQKVEPWKLYLMVTGFLLVDLVLLLTWQLYDPLQRRIEVFPLEDPVSTEDDVKIRPELEHCEMLVFGLFLAYETRSIKVKQINDSRYVGMSIYNVVVLCLITAPVTMVIASQQDASFAFVALAVIFCCFLSMALIFVPKVIEVIRHPRDKAESKYNPDVGMTKEDEEKYQKLVAENDELQKLISAKEDKIRLLKQRLQERDAAKGGGVAADGRYPLGAPPQDPAGLTVNKDTLIVADFITGEGTSDSAFGAGFSVYTRSSRASQSDFEFSESYL
uniref:Gamma-aminobutyric acid type B receptor subunit 2 n=1 Tax=Timema cristinae TaxID=61476 RepID=A0A7R9D260_TIMCR|nr:unnamed protein product [Timema cristinae]